MAEREAKEEHFGLRRSALGKTFSLSLSLFRSTRGFLCSAFFLLCILCFCDQLARVPSSCSEVAFSTCRLLRRYVLSPSAVFFRSFRDRR